MAELSDLYRKTVLAHNRDPHNHAPLEPCSHRAEGHNPVCGDRIRVYVRTGEDGRLEAVSFTGEACAICTASSSMMTDAVTGLDEAGVEALFHRLQTVLTDRASEGDALPGELPVLAGVRNFPGRTKCATLSWHTLLAALRGDETASSE
ncbi:nitrogen fixation NifU-like protein [Alkalispirillum mobile]|uniref:Nitrogen fixation NifU-like protein n=2 Tax=Alkalispirillum mobile TaxID=85925 RepID=A0A498C6K0_9GAMM|nr:nitrogen fixation NifU-like protein [Alkalispirillum mobile]